MASRKRSATISKLTSLLEERYGKKPKPPSWDIVDTLIFYIFYHSSGVTAARRAFKLFRDDYIDLNEVRVSSLKEIKTSLKKAGVNEKVALQFRSVLKQIFLRENEVSLEAINELTPDQVKRYLSKIDHLSDHAIDYLLLVKWDYPILPMDKHVAVMASRLGLVNRTNEKAVQRSLMRDIKNEDYFDFYSLFLEHTSKVCNDEPHCDRCVLIKHCKYGKSLSKK